MPTLRLPDGGHLAYQVDGAGPPLTFVSGLSGTGDFWEHQVAALRDRFRCVTHDQRGTGSSSLSPIRYSIAQMADDVLALLDELGIQRTAYAGCSTGAAIGLHLAAHHPERLSRLVLTGAWTAADAYMRQLFAVRRRILLGLDVETYQQFSDLFLYPPPFLQQAHKRFAAAYDAARRRPLPVPILDARMQAVLDFDVDALPARPSLPVLLIVAADDRLTPPYLAEALAARLPDAKVARLDCGGHLAAAVAPEAFAAPLSRFLDRMDMTTDGQAGADA